MNLDSKLLQGIEKLAPIAVAAVVSAAVWKWFPRFPVASADTFSNVTNVGGIAVGFLGTSQAFVFSMPRTAFVIRLRQLKAFPRLLRFFSSAIALCLATTVGSLVLAMICMDPEAKNAASLPRWLMLAWVFLSVWAAAATVRVIYFSDRILRVAFSEQS